VGYNEAKAPDISLDQLIGVLILLGADAVGVHPEHLGNMATQRAVEKYEAHEDGNED
jgi:hypothetical protein